MWRGNLPWKRPVQSPGAASRYSASCAAPSRNAYSELWLKPPTGVRGVDEASFEYARFSGGDERIALFLRGITEAEVPPGAVVRQHDPEID